MLKDVIKNLTLKWIEGLEVHHDGEVSPELSFEFDPMSVNLIKKAIEAVGNMEDEESIKLALVGVVDLEKGEVRLYPGSQRAEDKGGFLYLSMTGCPTLKDRDPRLGESNMWTVRLKSHHQLGRGFSGPVSHIHALYLSMSKPTISADDALNKRGFSLFYRKERRQNHPHP